MPEPTATLRLPAKSVAALAILGDQLDAMADDITIEVRTDAKRPYDPTPGDFQPSAKLRRLAARGVARLVCSENPNLSRITPALAATRLVKLGVPADVADAAAQPLANSRVLAAVELRPEQAAQATEAIVVGRGYARER